MILLKCYWKEDKFNEANKGKGRRRGGERETERKEGRKEKKKTERYASHWIDPSRTLCHSE